MDAVRAANVLNGFDPDCGAWLNAHRPAAADGSEPEARTGRRTGRRRARPEGA